MAWNLGNTSVRNPWRIQGGLRVFANEFSGNLDSSVQEHRFRDALLAADVIESGESDAESARWHGRKWRSCFCKLGFITAKKYRDVGGGRASNPAIAREVDLGLSGVAYEITPAGKNLFDADTAPAIADVFLRQLVRLEVSSPLEKDATEMRLKPFILVLQVLRELRNRNAKGLDQVEIAAFLQTATSHDDYLERVNNVLTFREQRNSQPGTRRKRISEIQVVAQQRALSVARMPKAASLLDYADTTSRYSRITGLVALRQNRLTLVEEKYPIVEAILANEPVFLSDTNSIAYLSRFYGGLLLSTESAATSLHSISDLEVRLRHRGITPVVDVADLREQSPEELTAARHRIENQYILLREDDFAKKHFEDNSEIENVLLLLRALNGDRSAAIVIEDKPAFLEWSVWRAMLIFDHLGVHPSRLLKKSPWDAVFDLP